MRLAIGGRTTARDAAKTHSEIHAVIRTRSSDATPRVPFFRRGLSRTLDPFFVPNYTEPQRLFFRSELLRTPLPVFVAKSPSGHSLRGRD